MSNILPPFTEEDIYKIEVWLARHDKKKCDCIIEKTYWNPEIFFYDGAGRSASGTMCNRFPFIIVICPECALMHTYSLGVILGVLRMREIVSGNHTIDATTNI